MTVYKVIVRSQVKRSLGRQPIGLIRYVFDRIKLLSLLFLCLFWSPPNQSQTALLDSLKQELKPGLSPEIQVNILFQLVDNAQAIARDTAERYANLAFEKMQSINNDSLWCLCYTKLASAQLMNSDYGSAEKNFKVAGDYCRTPERLGVLYSNMGVMYLRLRKSRQAIFYNKKALEYYDEQTQAKRKEIALVNIANVYLTTGDPEEGLQYLLEAMEINARTKNEQMRATNLITQAQLYVSLDQDEKAIEISLQSNDIFDEIAMPSGKIYGYYTLAEAYTKLKNYPLALRYCEMAFPLIEEVGDTSLLIVQKNQQANILSAMGRPQRAREVLGGNYQMAKDMNNQNLMTYSRLGLSKVEKAAGRLEQARAWMVLVKDSMKYLDHLEQLQMYEHFLELDSLLRDYENSYTHLVEYHQLKDSLFNEEKKEELANAQVQFEVLEKENEIKLLEKENQLKVIQVQQQRKNVTYGLLAAIFFFILAAYLFLQQKKLRTTKSQLEVSIGEKETLLREIHHRVKNNLQLIISLLSLQAREQPNQSIEEFLYKGQNRVKTIALIHERLYRTDNLSAINFEIYAKELLDEIFQHLAPADVQYELKADITKLDIEKAIPLGLILNELVSNALKHAFQNQVGGRLSIDLKNKLDEIQLVVQDNGIGYPVESQKGKTMGLQLVQLLVQQLRGKFSIENQNGTLVNIIFQKSSLLQ